MVGVFAVGLVFILLIIALIVYFWYIILPAIVVIVVIYILRNRKPRIKKTSSCWETLPKDEPSEDDSDSYEKEQRKKIQNRNWREKYERQQRSMLNKFNLAEFEAKLVFGEKWKNILAKKNTHDEKLVNSILKIQTKIMFDLDYRKEVIHLVDKLISTIDFVINAFPEAAKKYAKNLGPYEEIYIHQWKVFKKHKKTSFEIYSENKLTKAEAYNILELSENATYQQVKKKYRELAKKWHPDRNETGKKSVAEQMFVSITKAYETITAAA